MRVGVQFSGSVPASSSHTWFTHSWPPDWHVIWTVVPTTPNPGGPQIEWDVDVQRASSTHLTYWITIKNLSSAATTIEARYEIMN